MGPHNGWSIKFGGHTDFLILQFAEEVNAIVWFQWIQQRDQQWWCCKATVQPVDVAGMCL